jgi:hypothetical protein
MNHWEWIFRQSRVNDGIYDGDRLSAHAWDWPRQTWFQERLRQVRRAGGKAQDSTAGTLLGNAILYYRSERPEVSDRTIMVGARDI